MDLSELAKEINYSEEYSEDIKIDLFNKYAIPRHQEFINPLFELTKVLVDKRSYSKSVYTDSEHEHFNNGKYSCYSHSGAVASAFNENIKLNKANEINITPNGNIIVNGYNRTTQKHEKLIRFTVDKRIIIYKLALNSFNESFEIPRKNLYDVVDEFLIDFGYEKW